MIYPTEAQALTIATIVGAIIAGVVKIINAIGATRAQLLAGQQAAAARGIVRDKKILEIHLLVNSRMLNALKALVVSLKREADRTGLSADIDAWQVAIRDLADAEASAHSYSEIDLEESADEIQFADAADAKVLKLRTADEQKRAPKT